MPDETKPLPPKSDEALRLQRNGIRLQIATLLLTALAALGVCINAVRFDNQLKEAQVADATTEFVTVKGEVRPPEVFREIEGQMIGINPVVVTVSNEGRTPIAVKEIEFRVYRAAIKQIAKFDLPSPSFIMVANVTDDQKSEELFPVGTFDIESTKWEELRELRTLRSGPEEIRRGQQRVQTFHLLTPSQHKDFLIKIEAIVRPARKQNWTTQTWVGLSEPAVCAPGPFDTGVDQSFEAAPAAAPAPTGLLN